MKYRTIKETKTAMLKSGENWRIPFMEFVDDFRRTRNYSLIEQAFDLSNEKFDSLLASTIEYFCDETLDSIGVIVPEKVIPPMCRILPKMSDDRIAFGFACSLIAYAFDPEWSYTRINVPKEMIDINSITKYQRLVLLALSQAPNIWEYKKLSPNLMGIMKRIGLPDSLEKLKKKLKEN